MAGSDSSEAAGGGALRAQALLESDGETRRFEFDAVSVNTDDPARVIVALADREGRTLTLLLPRAELKRLLNWRSLIGL
ncbi:hypothetical protein [Rubritepida flocculans]|uniref:hypothetical protein n=1 Tax=Rubritepida flocculans TaxID=182403 RepID=UPI00041A416F|nr:hypothetical protein [Rubritepida flocculans]